MWKELWDAFCDWASEKWNWLKNFFRKIWEKIRSWWHALIEFMEAWLESLDDEVVFVDTSTKIGADIYTAIEKAQPITHNFSDYKKAMAMRFNSSTGELKQVAECNAKEVREKNDFDRELARDGIIRMKA